MTYRIAILLAAAVLAARAQDFTELERAARQELEAARIPGAAVGVVRGDRLVFAKGFGVASVETGAPVTPDMLFRLGSTTKMFTAAALVSLAVEGKIALDEPVGKVIPGLAPAVARITAHQLLTHTAGVRDEAPMYGSHDDEALGEGIRAWTDAWCFAPPGAVFSYSNPGYWLAGYVAERVSRRPYADVLAERIFGPLGMRRSTVRPLVAMTYPLAQGHGAGPDGKASIPRPAADNAATWPAGSIFSSVEDLSRFAIAFLNAGRIDGKQVLAPEVIARMSARHTRVPASDGSYGYGLFAGEFRGVRVVRHGGARMGYGSSIRMAPAERVAVIVLTNRTGADLPKTADKAFELLLPLQDAAASPSAKAALPVTEADAARYTGVYENGAQKAEILWKGGRLAARMGAMETPVVRRDEWRFAAERGPDFELVPGADGKGEYLCFGSRALRRTR